jgi:hypothetical protein
MRIASGIAVGAAVFLVLGWVGFVAILENPHAPWWPKAPAVLMVLAAGLIGGSSGVVSAVVGRSAIPSRVLGGVLFLYLVAGLLGGAGHGGMMRFVFTVLVGIASTVFGGWVSAGRHPRHRSLFW